MSHEAEPPGSARCPRCRLPTPRSGDNPWRPFCSERCRLVDLGDWLTGENAIPGEPARPDFPDGAGDSSGEPFQ